MPGGFCGHCMDEPCSCEAERKDMKGKVSLKITQLPEGGEITGVELGEDKLTIVINWEDTRPTVPHLVLEQDTVMRYWYGPRGFRRTTYVSKEPTCFCCKKKIPKGNTLFAYRVDRSWLEPGCDSPTYPYDQVGGTPAHRHLCLYCVAEDVAKFFQVTGGLVADRSRRWSAGIAMMVPPSPSNEWVNYIKMLVQRLNETREVNRNNWSIKGVARPC